MANLAYQDIGFGGGAITLQAAAGGGDTCQPDPRGFVWVKNGGGASINVTVTVPGTTFGQPNPDITVAVPAGGERPIGPLVAEMAASETFFVVLFAYSAVTSVTVAAVRLSAPLPNLPTL